MNAQELLREGRLKEAIQALGNEVRDHPADNQRRTFLFELLCFGGEYSRAEKHLNLLSDASPDAAIGALVYRAALSAERKRHAFFENKEYQKSPLPPLIPRPGKLNGERFYTIEDIDPRVGSRLEMFVAGEYVWVPFLHVGSLTMEAPRYLRDLIWSTALVTAGPALKGQDFGEVLLPVLHPFSWKHERETVKLGRETEWLPPEGEDLFETPYGQKLLVLDGERAVPFLEIRSLQFDDAVQAAPDAAVPDPS
jgi:type VI secretion system protein ImpE